MCGIAGIFNKNGVAVNDVQKMSQIIKHRGPDDEGFYLANNSSYGTFRGNDTIAELSDLIPLSEVNFQPSLALIHRRLSIIDTSALGHQPMTCADNRYQIVFNGEVYNYKEIRKELITLGHQFKSDSDTEVVLKAYVQWGEDAVARFVGMWSFVVYDNDSQTLFISRDRYGIKPLYFYKKDNFFAFASEIKALLQLKDVDGQVSNENMASFLTFGSTSNPYQNLFEHIKDVEPGHNYKFDLWSSKLSKQCYYAIDVPVKVNKAALQENTEKFSELFENSIGLHLRSDAEIGSCLSGGLDSSAIVYSASKQLGDTSLKTFTAAYKDADVDESAYAKMVANDLTNVQDIYTYPEAQTMIAEMDQMIYMQDLPIGSTSIFAQWEVMKCAKNNQVKVLLDGQGADEVLGGYYNYAGLYLVGLLRRFKFAKFLKDYQLLKQNFTPNMKNAVLRAAYYYMPVTVQKKLREKERLSFDFIDPNQLDTLSLQIPKRGGKTFDEHVNLSVKYGMYDLLRYEDRNSMAFSIESRVPFLDHRLVDFVRSLPEHQKINGGWTKFVLRKMLDGKLNDEVVWRKDKKGFVTPQKGWKNELMNNLVTELKDCRMPAIMNRNYVLELCNKDLSNPTHLSEFWRAYSVVKWYNIFNLSD